MIRNRFLVAPPPCWAAALLIGGSVLMQPLHAQGNVAAKQRVAAPGVTVQGVLPAPAPAPAAGVARLPSTQAQPQRAHLQPPAARIEAKVQIASDAVLENARQRMASAEGRRIVVVVAASPAASAPVVVQQGQLQMQEQAPADRSARTMQADRLGLRVSDDPLELDSGVALLVDAHTGEILLGKNDTVVLPIASITKLMTAILVVDSGLDLDQVITITQADVDRLRGSGSRLPVGAQLTRGQALHLALMSSENRAAHALARTFPGGVAQFVRQMNRKAVELGMHDTRFTDPTGLSGGNRSSARDLAMLTAASSHRPLVRELSVSPQYQLELGRRVLTYRNSNMLVRNGDWDINLQKTGFIREAGRTLVMQADVSGRSLIVVLLGASGSQARATDAERLRRWVLRSLFSTGPRPIDAVSADERSREALRQPG